MFIQQKIQSWKQQYFFIPFLKVYYFFNALPNFEPHFYFLKL
jgi:hypothetical protein